MKATCNARMWICVPICLCMILLTGCQLLNNRYIRVHKTKPDVTKIKIKVHSFRGPKEKVEGFFHSYKSGDMKSMEGSYCRQCDMTRIKDGVTDDYKLYTEILPDVETDDPVFNAAQDRVQVFVRFTIQKIHRYSGALFECKGKGHFVLGNDGGWTIMGYIGDPFWGYNSK